MRRVVTWPIVGIIAFMFFSPLSIPANDLIQACVRRNGAVHLIGDDFRRQSCRRHEMLVEWPSANNDGLTDRVADLEVRMGAVEVQVSDVLTSTINLENDVGALDTRVAALEELPTGLEVFDANGQQVGKLISVAQGFSQDGGNPSPAVVKMEAGGYAFALKVNHMGFINGAMFEGQVLIVYFHSNDCTGTPFVTPIPSGWPFWPVVAVVDTARTVYLADPDAALENIIARSWFQDGAGVGSCITGNATIQEAVRAIRLVDLGGLFAAPFKVR